MMQIPSPSPRNREELIGKKLEIILQELDSDNREIWDLPPFFQKLIEILLQMNVFFKIIFILLLLTFIVFALYKVSRLFMKNISYGKFTEQSNVKKESDVQTEINYLKSASEQSLLKEYSQAIITLHRGSVHNLFDKNILTRGRDYTNREIHQIISHQDTSEAFYIIALNAELITFKGKIALAGEYEEMEQLFRSYFL